MTELFTKLSFITKIEDLTLIDETEDRTSDLRNLTSFGFCITSLRCALITAFVGIPNSIFD